MAKPGSYAEYLELTKSQMDRDRGRFTGARPATTVAFADGTGVSTEISQDRKGNWTIHMVYYTLNQ